MAGLPRFAGPAYRRAIISLDEAIERLSGLGYTNVERRTPLEATVRSGDGSRGLRLVMTREGRVFGGNYALEVSPDRPVLPSTRGLRARGKGVVKLQGVAFRARRGDDAGARLAERLQADRRLAERLAAVHFERIRVDPDGRPVIRHLGGSVVWVLFPPIVKQIPLVQAQAEATVSALEAFAAAGRSRAG